MTVKELIKQLQKIKDKTLPIRVIEKKDNDDPNYWLDVNSVEVIFQSSSSPPVPVPPPILPVVKT